VDRAGTTPSHANTGDLIFLTFANDVKDPDASIEFGKGWWN
jgi:hypothetical protein